MRRILPLLIALLTFSIGVVISYSWSLRKGVEDFLVETIGAKLSQEEFVTQIHTCGIRASSKTYLISSTGETLEQSVEAFDSAEAAHEALLGRLSRAETILERTVILDDNKRPVGERVVAVVSSKALILKTKGAVLSIIKAPTAEWAVEFEAAMAKDH